MSNKKVYKFNTHFAAIQLFALIVVSPSTVWSQSIDDVPFRHIIIDREFPRYTHCKTVGDMNGEGYTDVLAASAFGQGLYWYAYPNLTKHLIDIGNDAPAKSYFWSAGVLACNYI